jgi:HPt (histidine-containing phosphotransfer) domain-containing protein
VITVTSKKQLKARVRARMTKTGESYTTALRHVVGAPTTVTDLGYTLRGGVQPETANIANVLAHHGIQCDGKPISEAVVFGVGGGPGAGYILWEFKQHSVAVLTLAFRNQWQYPDAWTEKTLQRLGVRFAVDHTSGAAGAAARLSRELAEGRPCIVRPDRFHIGYWHQPAMMSGRGGHDVVVYAERDGMAHVDDRNISPLLVRREDLDAARARVGSYKNSLYVIDPGTGQIDAATLRSAIQAGLRDAVEHLGSPSDSFSLPAWRKWSRLMTDTRNAKSWPKVFADRRGLAGALLSIWEGALPLGMDGGHLRDMYADFLEEAASLLDAPTIAEAAGPWRAAAQAWHAVASAAQPASIPELQRLRDLTVQIRESVADPSSVDPAEARQAADELWQLRSALDKELPLDQPAVQQLFEGLGEALADVYDRETVAHAKLQKEVDALQLS